MSVEIKFMRTAKLTQLYRKLKITEIKKKNNTFGKWTETDYHT
jgi:hypothetical protein